MLEAYRQHVAERAALGIPPLPLSKQQTLSPGFPTKLYESARRRRGLLKLNR